MLPGVAYVLYAVIGFFAAARYGLQTEGDVLVNEWLPGRWEGALSAGMSVYLSLRWAGEACGAGGRAQRVSRDGGALGGRPLCRQSVYLSLR